MCEAKEKKLKFKRDLRGKKEELNAVCSFFLKSGGLGEAELPSILFK